MGIGDFFNSLFNDNSTTEQAVHRYKTITTDDFQGYKVNGEIMRSALEVAVDYVAACVAKCEIQTYSKGKYTRGNDWYRWNVKPNINQSSTEFWVEVIRKLYFKGKVLILPVGEQLVIADDFTENKKALVPTTFSGITKEGYTVNGVYNTTNSIFLNRENNANINRLINGLGSILDNVMELACEHYYREGSEHGILQMETPPGLSDDELDAYIQEMNDYFEDFYKSRNGVAVLFEGMEYKPLSASNTAKNSIITDIREIAKEAYSKVAQAVKVPPALLMGDTATITPTVTDNMIQYAVMPILDTIVEKANAIMYTPDEYLSGNYIKVDYSQIKYMDATECAASIDKLRADGVYNVNELRVKFGETPIEQDFAEQYILTKNYAEVEQGEGDE